MTTPTTKSYKDARWDAIKKFETTGKPGTAFYLDGSGYVTIGYGTLVNKNGVTNPYAKAVISNADDPVLAQKMVDAFVGSKGTPAEVKSSLEGKGFVFDGSKIVGFKDGVDANGQPVITDIKNVLSEGGATKVTEGTIFVEKEKLVDSIETQLKMDFTEEQRAAVLSRVYNGVPKNDTITALRKDGTPDATIAFFASNRGGPEDANPGHYARTIEEAREFLGDSVKAATVGNAKGFTYTDKDGNEVFIGSQSEKVGGKTHAELVAYKVVTNEDQTQTQVPVNISSLPKYMNVAASGHLPLDPSVEFNNAYLTGDPAKMLNALSLDPSLKTPQAALDELHKYVPELGEEKDINLGTEAKPQWVKGYVITDEAGHATVLAVGKNAKGKPALVGYEIDAPTDANPNPEPHAIQVTAPQSKLPSLKTSDAGDTDSTVQVADDGNPESDDQSATATSDTPSDFRAALLEAFTNPTLPNASGPTTQYAGPGLPESAINPNSISEPSPNSYTAYLQSQGTALSPKQQAALTSQINQLKLGSSDDLSFYPLPDGSTLIANADGDLVGELGAPRNGEISLRANAIAEDGSATTHERYITTDGQATSYSPQALAQVNAGLSLVQGLDGLQHWEQMSDSARLSSLVGLANSFNTLSGGTLGNLGNLGTAASVLSLFQAMQDGNTAGIISGINGISGGQIDLAINTAVNNALGTASSVPYVSIALALNDFEKHPGQSIGTLVGMYFGGAIGGAIGGMVGGMLDGMFGGGKSAPPPPAGAVHFSWDADGQIQHTIDHNQSGGGTAANQAAAGVQALLENVVQAVNEANLQKTGDHSQDVAINPYLLPRIHYGSGGASMEVTQFDGSTTLEGIGQEGFAERLISILQDNGGLAPAWQVATIQGHWAQAQEELADLRAQYEMAVESESPQAEALQQQIDTRQQALDHELKIGKGGHAYAGNEAYSLQGNASESADFKTQDFGVLVMHIAPRIAQHAGVQASAQASNDDHMRVAA